MQVHGAHTGLTPSGYGVSATSAEPSPASRSSTSVEKQKSEGSASPLIVFLQSRLSSLPEVRLERVEAVRQALASGEYLTRAAAEATATSILNENS